MRTLLSFILFIFLSQSALADAPKSLSVRVDFNYQNNQSGNDDRYTLNNNIQMESNNPQWTIVSNQKPSPHHNDIILLSKIEKLDSEKVALAFLIVDAGKNPHILSKPKLIVLYGQKGQITIHKKNSEIQLGVLAAA